MMNIVLTHKSYLYECQRRFNFADYRQLKNAGKRRWGNVKKLVLPLLEQDIGNVLFLLHVFLAFFEPVALAFDVNDRCVVQNTVKDRWGDGDVGENLVPLGEGFVGGEDGGGS